MLHLKARLSNFIEHLFISLYQFINSHMLFLIIEPDTTLGDGEDVSNAAITISGKLAAEISGCGVNTDAGQCNILTGLIHSSTREMFIEWSGQRGSAPLQYCPQFHSFGFQPWYPSPTQLLHMLDLPVWRQVILPVKRVCRYPDGHYCYSFRKPTLIQLWFYPFAYIINRNAFRYSDTRYK